MHAKQLIPQQVIPFNAILKVMTTKRHPLSDQHDIAASTKHSFPCWYQWHLYSWHSPYCIENGLHFFCTMMLEMLNISCLKSQAVLFCLKYIFKLPSKLKIIYLSLHSKGKVQETLKKLMLAWPISVQLAMLLVSKKWIGQGNIFWKILKTMQPT